MMVVAMIAGGKNKATVKIKKGKRGKLHKNGIKCLKMSPFWVNHSKQKTSPVSIYAGKNGSHRRGQLVG